MDKKASIHSAQKTAIAILHYLRDYPSAKDTIEGIAKWWIREEVEVVERALELLVDEGVLEQHGLIYQLAHNHEEIKAGAIINKALLRLRKN